MNSILATGGLDDVALGFGELILFAVLFVVAGVIVFSWWKRSLIAVVIASVLLLAAAALFQPWTLIRSDGAYDAFWLFWLRIVAIIWLLLAIATSVCLFKVIRHRLRRRSVA